MKLRYLETKFNTRLQYFDKEAQHWFDIPIVNESCIDRPFDFKTNDYPKKHNDLYKV